MTPAELLALVADYRAGLDAEITLLRRLESLSIRQRELTRSGDLDGLPDITDARDQVMAGLVAIEHELIPNRLALVAHQAALTSVDEFREVAELHAQAAALITEIVLSDKTSLDALKDAERGRREAAQALGQGESTLAAYRRVVSPPVAGAALVNRTG
jgi:hypothetical protein